MLNVRIAVAFVIGAALSPCALQAQITVLQGSSLPTDQGWSVQTNIASPDVSTDGTVITANTIGTPQGTTARLLFYKDVGVVDGRFWVEFRLKLISLAAVHNTRDAGLAVFGVIDPATTNGTTSDRNDMIYFDTSEIGWGDGGQSFSMNTTSTFHDYRIEFDDGGIFESTVRAYVDGIERLSNSIWAVPTGVIAFGDMTTDLNLNSTYQIEWVRIFRDCNRNDVEDSTDLGNGGTDCNANDLLDECEAASYDCNGNGLHDACDIQSGFSLDGNGDEFPDECSMNVLPNGVAPDPTGIDKSRFISFVPPPPPEGDWATSALRIRLVSLHHVDPPYAGGATIPFTIFEGQSAWVGTPTPYPESVSFPVPFLASLTQCVPLYRDWSTIGLMHLTGSQIVPSSVYHVENVSRHCQGIEDSCSLVSPPLEVKTSRWGDVWEQFNPPSETIQPDIADIGALVNKFRSAPGAPIKARAYQAGAPGNAWGMMNESMLQVDYGWSHTSLAVDAFRGIPYPYKMGKCANNNTACSDHATCGANGPCELYCPE